jgi:hypothetical protein
MLENLTQETIDLAKAALGTPSDELTKAYTQPSTAITGIAAYDLEAPSRNARAIL